MSPAIYVLIIHGLCVLNLVIVEATELPEICPDVVTRQQWGGQDPGYIDYTVFPLDIAIIHHTVSDPCNTKESCSELVRSFQNYHMQPSLDYGDIGYNFLVGGDGKVYEGRGWHKVGAHTYRYNIKSVGIAFIGTFINVVPPSIQLQAAKDLLECGVKLGELSENYKLYGANQVSSTQSPGTKLYNQIKKWPHFAQP